MIARLTLIVAVLTAPFTALAFGSEGKTLATVPGSLSRRLNSLIEAHKGDVAVAIKHLPTGETFDHNASRPMPTASLIKFPVLVTAHRFSSDNNADSCFSWEDRVVLKDEHKVPGSGVLTKHFSSGMSLTLRDAAHLMIVFSDNTATNLVVDAIGIRRTADYMEQLGLSNTKLHSKVYRRDLSVFPKRSREFGLGSTTASEMLLLFERLWKDQLVSPTACKAMRQDLFACKDKTKLARYLPLGVPIAHKSGEVSQSRCDAGVIDGPSGATIVCVLTTNNQDHEYYDNHPANLLCAEIGRVVFAHFHLDSDQAADNLQAVTLKSGDMGVLVKSLQRTLNKRLRPSPHLSLDGDFGPATERAVKLFQKSVSVPANGIVDTATWQAIGTLETEDSPLPPPDVVNSKVLATAPRDKKNGVPFVTCKAWCVMDADRGNILGGYNLDKPLDIASTTKIMTAAVALDCCDRDASLLDEVIVFSKRADDTPGSTSDIAAGEQILVRELFYGLLLPSGNDASVAMAEFFGKHLGENATNEIRSNSQGYDRFVQAMNNKANQLGMEATFKNTHGLTEPGHVASAKSLAILSRSTMKNKFFRDVVATRQRGYAVQSQSGYTRNVVWKNTNRLLKIDGYHGIKTGTTNAAGACLVSYGTRDDKAVIVVVLGAASSDARYTDTRNLFRWAWGELAIQRKN